ncbi:ATP-binding protein [Paenibacillaceae bacterium WGS1546]|uniref:sensor histidine kinase n=1 Tax=Cohnella sp. WGS1546 TaxID=3366810 RepID=UPI00372D0072
MTTSVSIKIKFSLFLAILLVLTILVLSAFVLNGVKEQQQTRTEKELRQQAHAANLSVKQAYLTSPSVEAQRFLRSRGQQLALDLALYSGLHVVLYDAAGGKVGDSVPNAVSNYGVEDALSYALQGKIAYQQEGRSLLYLAPLQGPGQQMGVIQFQYSLANDIRFHDSIVRLFLYAGAAVLAVSFILGYLYFRRATSAIVALNDAAEQIRAGRFLRLPPLKRKDELGRLSQGIYYMSNEIQRNIAAMKAEETKLRQAVEKLEALERQRKQFIGNISHEFKTPLTSIKAYSELMELYPGDRAMTEDAVRHIQLETDRLTDMVDKVLRLSALEKYDFEYRPEPVNLKTLLRDLIERMKAKAERFGVRIAASLEDVTIWADRESLVHIFINVLDNGIKYNVQGGELRVVNRAEGAAAIVEIADTGIGIPDEVRDKIFEPFYTVNKDRSRQSGGTGLGLALVKQLVAKHGGTVEAIGSEEGATFRLVFPRHRDLPHKEELS